MRILILATFCTLLAACGTLAPGADRVIVTRDKHLIEHCTPVGSVGADPNVLNSVLGDYNGAGYFKLRNDAMILHADHVLLTGYPSQGVAYRCTK